MVTMLSWVAEVPGHGKILTEYIGVRVHRSGEDDPAVPLDCYGTANRST